VDRIDLVVLRSTFHIRAPSHDPATIKDHRGGETNGSPGAAGSLVSIWEREEGEANTLAKVPAYRTGCD
jgi:hypothetical protein